MSKTIKFGFPKGSLQESTFSLFRNAGFSVSVSKRSYFPNIDDEQIDPVLIRAQEISRYVEDGILDAGLTGKDWIMENNSKVIEVANLVYAKQGMRPVRWVLAVARTSEVTRVQQLKGKRIATEAVNLTKTYLRKHKVKANVEFSWGATEVKVPELADAIVELTETGRSLEENNLRIVDVVLESTTRLIANKKSWSVKWKKEKLNNMALLLQGAINADKKVALKMNIPDKKLKKVLSLLPALKTPTISPLYKRDWHAIEIVVDETIVRKLIPKLKNAGAEGIIEIPLNKLIY